MLGVSVLPISTIFQLDFELFLYFRTMLYIFFFHIFMERFNNLLQISYMNIDETEKYQEILLRVYAFSFTAEHQSGM